jgi:Glycosyl transferase family 2
VNQPSLVSVVVPTRNARRTIETCLRSVRAQTYPALELIVVDNGSTDGTWTAAVRHADVALRGGPERSAQRNLGVAHATGEWVLYVDADMELHPDVVERAVRAGRDAGAVGVSIPEESVGRGFWARCRTLERRCLRGEPSLLWPRLIRTGYLRATGGFAVWLTGTEDADLHHRMLAHGAPIVTADALILHDEGRLTLGGLVRKRFYYGKGLRAYRRAHPGAISAQVRAIARTAWRHRRPLLAEPLPAAGIVAMRTVELVAYLAGALAGGRRGAAQASASSLATMSASSASASSVNRSRARSDTVEGPPGSPAAPTATAERPRATGKKSSRVAPGTAQGPTLETSSESEPRRATGPSSRPSRGDHT